MARIAGVNVPDNKITLVALEYIYGIGRSKAIEICNNTSIDQNKKIKDLSESDLDKIRNYIDKNIKTEGDLKLIINQNIKRLKEVSSYRGIRHIKKLPARGQRTKTNARTKRGKRMCVGSGRKSSNEKT